MIVRSFAIAPLALALFAIGCGDPASTQPTAAATTSAKPKASAKPMASASAATSAAPAPSGSADAARGGMSHCPNAVAGAKVDIQDDPKGIVMTVTGADEKGTAEIRERAKWVSEKAKQEVGKIQHSGEGGGGGVLGRCPIVLKGTNVTIVDAEGGTKITILVDDAKEVDWLRREVRERQAKLAEPGSAEAGSRKMANCPSAADGAETKIEEKPDAVLVTITTKDAAAVADLRERAKKLGEAAKAAGSDKHDGGGAGTGTGRCPVVLEETTIEAKDVDGGVAITVKPKKAADLAKVAKETKERAERFGKDDKAAEEKKDGDKKPEEKDPKKL